MKRIILLLAMSVLSSAISFGQKKYEMVVKKTDGTESVFNTEDVARTYFRERGHSDTFCPDSNHPHLIDLGLPSGTKWACCNVGADKPEAYGGYYSWGEVSEKSVYNDITYKYATGVDKDGDGSYDDWHSDTGTYGIWQSLGSDISGTEYDVAHVKWGGKWCLPTFDDMKELLDNCTTEWTTLNGVNGRKFISKINGNSIFLPAACDRWYGRLSSAGSYGNYWSSTQYPGSSNGVSGLYFSSGYAYCYDIGSRGYGRPVRPVVRN